SRWRSTSIAVSSSTQSCASRKSCPRKPLPQPRINEPTISPLISRGRRRSPPGTSKPSRKEGQGMGSFSGRLHRIGATDGIAVTGGMVDESDGLRQSLRGTLTAPEGTASRSSEIFTLNRDDEL